MTRHANMFEPLTLNEIDELFGWPADSQHMLARVYDMLDMAQEQAARRLCESRLPDGWSLDMGSVRPYLPRAGQFFARAFGNTRHGVAAASSDIEGYGASPAEAYVDLAGKLPGGRP